MQMWLGLILGLLLSACSSQVSLAPAMVPKDHEAPSLPAPPSSPETELILDSNCPHYRNQTKCIDPFRK